ncbi:hypothetical protein GCM10009834_15680 [Streptomonospora arabica]|uniref:Uncharacterized protein n=1 Tax=Streptomonospora halophila TaxID=427369 RepID=A0ABP9GR37_9ACTN
MPYRAGGGCTRTGPAGAGGDDRSGPGPIAAIGARRRRAAGLSHGHADGFGVGAQPYRAAIARLSGRMQDVVVQVDIECDQKGVEVCLHTLIFGALRHARSRFGKLPSTIYWSA